MSYAIIRNVKYKRENLKGIYRHNERKNYNYSNRNIDKEKSYLNYAIKNPMYSYEKEFDRLKEKYDLKGQIKTVSNIACEYIITSNKEFFDEIGEEATKRYFETAYQFVSKYKNLGEKYILSAQVHMDEETPHMHLVFLPVVHTTDKKGNKIDKLACSEFWKSKDSYRELQNAFYDYMVSHNFNLLRGLPKEETNRQHLDIKEYKELTNFNVTKELVESITLDIPEETNINDLKKIMFNKNEKILNDIIKPKEKMIKQLYKENKALHKELSRQTNIVDDAEKYQIERDSIIADNKALHKKVNKLECEYKNKSIELEFKYNDKYERLENENNKLHDIIDRFYTTIVLFIKWVCNKFALGDSRKIIRDFEGENNICINPVKQIASEQEDEEEM